MSKRKKLLIRLLAIVIAIAMPLATALVSFADSSSGTPSTASKYASPDINVITGHGAEPEELSVSAAATYQEKAWYEYVTYSDKAVCSYRLNDDSRILFYDPYTYTNSMIMDVQFDATTTEFDTMSEYTVSNTTSKSIAGAVESTYTSSSATQTSGKDEYHTEVTNGGFTHTKYNYDEIHSTDGSVKEKTEYTYKKYDTTSMTISETLDVGTKTETGTKGINVYVDVASHTTVSDTFGTQWLQDNQTKTTTYSGYKSTVTHDYEYDIEDHTTSATEGWEQLSARVTQTIGSSNSTSNSWSETESTTVTKTYAATHFAADGVTPLPWAIVHYSVQMPMKCCLQYKISGEWVTISTVYCLLTTVKGTCRTWMQNGQAYYEDWGNGEPVTSVDFWSQFMTKDQLMNAYTQKLYPVGGED